MPKRASQDPDFKNFQQWCHEHAHPQHSSADCMTYLVECMTSRAEGYQAWVRVGLPGEGAATTYQRKLMAERIADYWCRRYPGTCFRVREPGGRVVWAGRYHNDRICTDHTFRS